MTRKYFGTDGIRGTVGQPPITPDFVLRLAHAVACVLKRSEARSTVLICKDTRISGYMLESALESGFNSAGVDVVLLRPLPTPGVAYLTRAQRASLGVVISASHNPFADNGIKFFSALGAKLPDECEQAVEATLEEPTQWVDSARLGKARRLNDAAGRYFEFCKSTFDPNLTLRGTRIVVGATRGAAYRITPLVFHELGAEVHTHQLHARRDEHQPRRRRDPSRGPGQGGARARSAPAAPSRCCAAWPRPPMRRWRAAPTCWCGPNRHYRPAKRQRPGMCKQSPVLIRSRAPRSQIVGPRGALTGGQVDATLS